MLDVVLIVVVLALTVATLLYGAACDELMRIDATRDVGADDAAANA